MNHLSIVRMAVAGLLLACSVAVAAESVTYEVVKDNNLKYFIRPFGLKPQYSYAEFYNEYGSIVGNRYNQITNTKTATLYLTGWEGCTIKRITFNMCSNASSGAASYRVTAGATELFSLNRTSFDSPNWYGSWVSYATYLYVDVTNPMSLDYVVGADEEVAITITGSESSVYINSYTIEYEAGNRPTESALGYQYTRINRNEVIADGEDVILYYAGTAAGDIDASATNPYMDMYPVANIQNVNEPELMYFKLRQNGSAWHFVNQYGDTLGATAVTHLAWNAGGMSWNITIGYNGAEISNTNSNYGMLRYNAPSGSYVRITNYTSTSQQFPYLYRRVRQNTPVGTTSLTMPANLTITMCVDTTILRPVLLPQNATDRRLRWHSTDASVATVADGILRPVSEGVADIVVYNSDSTLTDTCRVVVASCATAIEPTVISGVYARDRQIVVEQGAPTDVAVYSLLGRLIERREQVLNAAFDVEQGVYLVKVGRATMKLVVE